MAAASSDQTVKRDRWLHFSDGMTKIHGVPFAFEGRLLFSFPYTEDKPKFEEKLIMDLVTALDAWLKVRWPASMLPGSGTVTGKLSSTPFRDVVLGSIHTSPKNWADPTIQPRGRDKYLAYVKFMAIGYIMDDILERYIGTKGYTQLLNVVTRIATLAFTQGYVNEQSFQRDVKESLAKLEGGDNLKIFVPVLKIWYDLGEDLHTDFGMTWETAKWLAHSFKLHLAYQGWLGRDGGDQLKNLSLRKVLREHTVAAHPIIEFFYILDGVRVGAGVRDEMHFQRYRTLVADLVSLKNDIFSLKKEAAEEAEAAGARAGEHQVGGKTKKRAGGAMADNIILLYHTIQNLTYEQSLLKTTQKQAEKCRELSQIYEYLVKIWTKDQGDNDQEDDDDDDNDHGYAEEVKMWRSKPERETTKHRLRALEIAADFCGGCFWGQISMTGRYTPFNIYIVYEDKKE